MQGEEIAAGAPQGTDTTVYTQMTSQGATSAPQDGITTPVPHCGPQDSTRRQNPDSPTPGAHDSDSTDPTRPNPEPPIPPPRSQDAITGGGTSLHGATSADNPLGPVGTETAETNNGTDNVDTEPLIKIPNTSEKPKREMKSCDLILQLLIYLALTIYLALHAR